jgi:Protein of unknown function (DUF4232)
MAKEAVVARPFRVMMACAGAVIVAGCSVPQGPVTQGPATHDTVPLMHGTVPHASTAARPRPAAAVPTAASPGTAIPACRRSQLAAGGLGISAAAGTGILTIRITNVSPRSCSLQGRPAVAFLDAAGQALRVAKPAMPGVPRTVVPLPAQAGYSTAGFVITTADDQMPGEPCQAVTALRVVLPSVPGSFTVGGLSNPDFHYTVCESAAAISPIAAAALIDGYAPAFQACLPAWLRASAVVQATSAAGTRLVVTVTNRSTAPCTLDGYPDATLTTSSGPAALAYRAGRADALLPAPAFPRPVTLVDGASASAVLATAAPDQCGSQCRTWSALSIGLPGGPGALRINRAFGVCGAVPGAGAFVSV